MSKCHKNTFLSHLLHYLTFKYETELSIYVQMFSKQVVLFIRCDGYLISRLYLLVSHVVYRPGPGIDQDMIANCVVR